ncbi:hypothetical protein [Sandaracinus amylolyticus]|uniref:Uncharacterized protein n=1 Tax=Sandaracinus amylolyticus TaxID=927083 RepID=A0A0F6W6V0_9BACT|nr:hypothetical protein [Sandaracinus amylolyticus]AKF09000.1 hypothetical protein DB32_006149 [Sandaracinus amylolyticus]
MGDDARCPFCGNDIEGRAPRTGAVVAAAVAVAAGVAVTATTLGCVYGAPDPGRPDAAQDGATDDAGDPSP